MNGSLIRKVRKEKGYTLEELAEMYTDKYSKPMDKGQLSRYERELVDACFSTTKEIADLLNIELVDLITPNPISSIEDMFIFKEKKS